MLQIISALTLPILDRIRGDGHPPVPRPIIKALMGFAILFTLLGTLSVPWQLILLVVVGHMIGESIGWGVAIGAGLGKVDKSTWDVWKKGSPERKTEWYLKIPVINYSWQTALLFRGSLWALIPAIGLYLYVGLLAAVVVLLAHAFGMVAGIYAAHLAEGKDKSVAKIVSKLSFTNFTSDDRWAMQEIYRGFIVGIILLIGSLFINAPSNVISQDAHTEAPELLVENVAPQIIVKEVVVEKIVEVVKIKEIVQECPIREIKTTITREITSLTPEEAALME